MNYQNFITTLSIRKEQEIKRWIMYTSIISITTILSIGMFESWHMYYWWQAKKEYQNLLNQQQQFLLLCDQKTLLMAQEKEQKRLITKINNYTQQHKNPVHLLQTLLSEINISMSNLIINKKNLVLTCHHQDELALLEYFKMLGSKPELSNLKIGSLQMTKENYWSCSCNATINYQPQLNL